MLGLDSTADTAEVKRAFRNLAMQYHPVSALPKSAWYLLYLRAFVLIQRCLDTCAFLMQDVSTLPNAAEKFEEVRVAADQILNRVGPTIRLVRMNLL